MAALSLPSPPQAQLYRADVLCPASEAIEDDLENDDEAQRHTANQELVRAAVKRCNPTGPLVMYISKMVEDSASRGGHGHFLAFGRVFSGTIRSGTKVHVLGTDRATTYRNKSVQKLRVWMGPKHQSIPFACAGNTVAVGGLEGYILKTATITDHDHIAPIAPVGHNACKLVLSLRLRRHSQMRFGVSPVVSVAVEPKRPSHLSKLAEGLKWLSHSDPLVQVHRSFTRPVPSQD